MIYETVGIDEPISQGDIFKSIPRVDLSFQSMMVVDGYLRQTTWGEAIALNATAAISAVLPIKPVMGIVITQNCDAARCDYLCLCEIGEYIAVAGQSTPKDTKGWKDLIVRNRNLHRVFYLPADPKIGLTERQGVDFRLVLRISRLDIEGFKQQRIGKLNKIANEHFREALAFFFRRYAYNEWYPFTREEFEAYRNGFKDEAEKANITPYEWQSEEPSQPSELSPASEA